MKKVTVLLEGKEYTLKYTLNSMRKLEKEFNLKLEELGEKFDIEMVQALLYVGLIKHHPELDFETVGDMVDMAEVQGVVSALSEALGGLQQ